MDSSLSMRFCPHAKIRYQIFDYLFKEFKFLTIDGDFCLFLVIEEKDQDFVKRLRYSFNFPSQGSRLSSFSIQCINAFG